MSCILGICRHWLVTSKLPYVLLQWTLVTSRQPAVDPLLACDLMQDYHYGATVDTLSSGTVGTISIYQRGFNTSKVENILLWLAFGSFKLVLNMGASWITS